jgi:mRNA interferase MazF
MILSRTLEYGGIYLANLNPNRKIAPTEVSKTRPVLVMQSEALLEVEHPSTIILPLTTQLQNDSALRFRIQAQGNLKQNSDLILDQIRAIDNQRFQSIEPLCLLDRSVMNKIFKALLDILKP